MTINDIDTHHEIADATRTEANDSLVLQDSEAATLLRAAPWRRFAVIGDSTAAGVGDPTPGYETVSWNNRLGRWLLAAHPNAEYHTTGRMGATITEVAAEQLADLHRFHPDLVHVTCGGNDLFRRDVDLGQVERDLDELCTAATATGARLSMFTLADAATGPLVSMRPRLAAFADIVRRVAARHDAILTEFWSHEARLRPDWLSSDFIHLSMSGHAVVASEMAKSLAHHANPETPQPEFRSGH
ncbi:SGNH/GDSL hydrolase family protein [Nocardia huaxiensis]|uniref:SGNH/GDSL hydrolase family protein n=1 Tax=Nocardia huaxiensis TaxID=2755382 RepID=UPI001FD35676|nr:SGNH/GDSL hydrolase family protein [Nocardia huaxiensis]